MDSTSITSAGEAAARETIPRRRLRGFAINVTGQSMSKYRAKRTNGYASKREYLHAVNLHALEDAGEIKDLREQVSYELIPKDKLGRAIRYVADFCYWDIKRGRHVVCDVKGFRTDTYKLKRRLMWNVHKILIEEV
jgi:hypothetical protein